MDVSQAAGDFSMARTRIFRSPDGDAAQHGRPTREQEELLAAVTDPRQRAILLDCIRRGDHIPEFAWRPIPLLTKRQESAFTDLVGALRERAARREMLSHEYLASMASYDAADILRRGADRLNAARFITESTRGLEPLDDAPDEEIVPLFAWGIFNPYGPTVVTLVLRLVAESSHYVLQLSWRHPIESHETGYALIPSHLVSDSAAVAAVIEEVFRQNGSTRYPIMVGSLPSHVLVFPGGLLHHDQVRELFFLLIPRAAPEDLVTTSLQLRHFRGSPWERATVEVQAARKASLDRLNGKPEPPISWPPPRPLCEAWWNCVTDDEHVRSELEHMGAAWEGALVSPRGEFENPKSNPLTPKLESTDEIDFVAHFRTLTLERLREVAHAPQTSFRQGAWDALQAELSRRDVSVANSSSAATRVTPRSDSGGAATGGLPLGDPGSEAYRLNWQRVARAAASGMDPDTLHQLTAGVIQTDPRFAPFRQPGYPNDALVLFPFSRLAPSTELAAISGGENMWVRLLTTASQIDSWIGRLLNSPHAPVSLKKDDYVIVSCTQQGLFYLEKANL